MKGILMNLAIQNFTYPLQQVDAPTPAFDKSHSYAAHQAQISLSSKEVASSLTIERFKSAVVNDPTPSVTVLGKLFDYYILGRQDEKKESISTQEKFCATREYHPSTFDTKKYPLKFPENNYRVICATKNVALENNLDCDCHRHLCYLPMLFNIMSNEPGTTLTNTTFLTKKIELKDGSVVIDYLNTEGAFTTSFINNFENSQMELSAIKRCLEQKVSDRNLAITLSSVLGGAALVGLSVLLGIVLKNKRKKNLGQGYSEII